MKLVGLSGGIACGKSTFAGELRSAGFTVIDIDEIAKAVVHKGGWGHRRVARAFGSVVLNADGEIDRVVLGDLVFNDPQARRRLNKATHLPILIRLLGELVMNFLKFNTVVIIDMPLLFETGFHRLTSPNLLLAADVDTQRRRLMLRDGLTAAAADARINSQMPLDAKRRLADIVVENEGERGELTESARMVGLLLRRHRWLHLLFFSPLGLSLGMAALFSLR